MTAAMRCCLLTVVVLLCGLGSGCSFFPEALQPGELWKLNRGPGYNQDPFFSVPDNTPVGVKQPIDLDGDKVSQRDL